MALKHTKNSTARDSSTPASKPRSAEASGLVVALSVKVRHLVDGIRDDFTMFTEGFASLTATRELLAPKFMKAFSSWQGETEGTFAGFVRELDPSVPEGRDGYRAHASYQAADYLRRLMAQAEREPVAAEDRPVSTYTALAHLVATVLPSIDPTGVIWGAFVREMRWTDAQAERLKVTAAKIGAVKLPPTVRHKLTSMPALLAKAS
jgi:hypothetical protein